MFRGGARLILAHILCWFLPSHSPCTGEELNQIYFNSSVQQDLCKGPMPQKHSQSPAACAFSHRKLRKEKRKALDRVQLKKCHPLTHCTSVSCFSQTITVFSAPGFLGFYSHTIFMMFCCYPKSMDEPPKPNLRQRGADRAAVGGWAGIPAHSWLPFGFGQLTWHPLCLLLACKWGMQHLPVFCEALGDQQMEHLI